ncbi:MAG: FtsX-like permease family protein [Planctomycetota bacterium]
MIAAFSPFLAVRYLVTRRINLLGTFGVAFAVWAMIVVDSVFTGFVTEIRADVRRSTTDLLVTDLPHETGYETLRAVLGADADVAATAPRLRHHGLFQPLHPQGRASRPIASAEVDFNHMESGFALLLGIDPVLEEPVSHPGDWLTRAPEVFAAHHVEVPRSTVFDEPDPQRRAMLLLPDEVEWNARRRADLPREPRLADSKSVWPGLLLGWRRYPYTPRMEPGDPLDLLCAAYRPDATGGAALHPHSMRIAFAGWFATGHRMFDETTALLPIETLRTLLGQDAAEPNSIDLVTDVAVRVRPGLSAADLLACKHRLCFAVQKVLPNGSGVCSVLDWEEQNSVFLSAVAHEQGMMQFVLFVVMLVAAFVIYATLHMMVVQKVKDIGILAALGGTPRAIGAVFLLGGLTVAILGALLGAGFGVLSVQWINPVNDWLFAKTGLELFPRALFDLQRIPCRLQVSWLLKVTIGAVVLALLVAFVPSRKASRMNPVKALSYE